MQMGEIVKALPALRKLAGADLTPRTLYQVSRLMSKLDRELAFFNRQRVKALGELGTKLEEGRWQIPPENRQAFEDRMTELANIEIEGEIKPVKLPVTENVSLSYNDICALKGLIELDSIEET